MLESTKQMTSRAVKKTAGYDWTGRYVQRAYYTKRVNLVQTLFQVKYI